MPTIMPMTNRPMRARDWLPTIFTIQLVFLFFLIEIYPSLSDFDYWHVVESSNIAKSGSVGDEPIPGFYILSVSLSSLSGIADVTLPTLPLQLIPLILSLLFVMRRISHSRFMIPGLVVVWLTFSSDPIPFTWGVHSLAEILFLEIVAVAVVRMQSNSAKVRASTSIILIILVLSVNFMSYKLTLASVSFILFLQIVNSIRKAWTKNDDVPINPRLATIALTTVVLVLSFNLYFYRTFLPTMELGAQYSSSSGWYKFFHTFSPNANDPLSNYYYHNPKLLVAMNVIWLIVVLIGLLLLLAVILIKFFKHVKMTSGDRIALSMGFSGLVILWVYTTRGLFEIGPIVLAVFIGFATLYELRNTNIKRAIIASVGVLALLNLCISAIVVSDNLFYGQKDSGAFEYIKPVAQWYIQYVPESVGSGDQTLTGSDVLTYGFLFLSSSNDNSMDKRILTVLTREQLEFLLESNDSFLDGIGDNTNYVFAINYQEQHFSIMGWNVFQSWSLSRPAISINEHIEVISSFGAVDFLQVRK